MPKYRPDIRADFSIAAWNRSPADIAARAAERLPMDGWLMNNQPTHIAELAPGEARCACPRCDSPYIVQFGKDETKFGRWLPDFVCVAGDCAVAHPVMCNSELADRAEAARRCELVHGPLGYAKRRDN